MDYKEKYEMALEGIQEILGSGEDSIKMSRLQLRLQGIFPELKESEDDNIRKAIHIYLDWLDGKKDYAPRGEYTINDMIDWIEKQGKHQKFRDSIQVGDKVTRNEDGVLVNLSQLNRVAKKQGEQKPTDKVEPKFREGDWVVYCNDDVDLITGIEENGYCINNGGYIPFVCENEMRLWNITDAKVGDVLVSESTCGLGTWYCIFKSLDGDESMTVYCYLARDGRFETKKELCFDKDPYNTKPATKEQRDLLFQKMKEAGYEWDAENKELKKIEQKPAWSEEDERYFNSIAHALSVLLVDPYLDEIKLEHIGWFSSLKDRYAWRPSDEQMDALHYVTNFDYGGHKSTLVSLYEQLKKLK